MKAELDKKNRIKVMQNYEEMEKIRQKISAKINRELGKELKVENIKQEELCRECGTSSITSPALLNSLVSIDDFGGDAGGRGTTQSRVGVPKLVDSQKCPKCGHSWII